MCLIAHRSGNSSGRGSNIPNNVLSYNRYSNPDGFGIAWREDGKLLHQKFDPKEYDQFHDLLKRIDKDQTIEYVAHWRKATHGPICQDMSHPFSYEDSKDGEVLVFHNGIIGNHPPKGKSDTAEFVDSILSRIPPRWWANPAFRWLVEESTGWSRFLIMTKDETVRLNKAAWSVMNGIWYSTTPVPSSYKNDTTGASYDYKGKDEYKGKAAAESWSAFADDDDDDDDDEFEDGSVPANLYGGGWPHQGHWVSPISEEHDLGDRDTYGQAICERCKTMGEYYLIDGKAFIDVPHENPVIYSSF